MLVAGRVAGAADQDFVARHDHAPRRHLVAGERAGLVGADHLRGAQSFDRVEALDTETRIVWQMHSWNEPFVGSSSFETRQDEGRLECQTFLPAKVKVGKDLQKLTGSENTRSNIWRVTVEPEKTAKSEMFLHVLHATDSDKQNKLDIEMTKRAGFVTLKFRADGKQYKVSFRTSGSRGGNIEITKGGKTICKTKFTTKVQEQGGWGVGK